MLELNSSLVNALLVLSGGAFAMILRLIHSHSVYLYGHRLHSEGTRPFESRSRTPRTCHSMDASEPS